MYPGVYIYAIMKLTLVYGFRLNLFTEGNTKSRQRLVLYIHQLLLQWHYLLVFKLMGFFLIPSADLERYLLKHRGLSLNSLYLPVT